MSDCEIQAGEAHSGCDDGRTSQLEQRTELRNGKEPGRWINDVEWLKCIEGNYDLRRSWPSIFRVPNGLKKESKEGEAYVPKRVSLGPYHHTSADLPPMNSHKGRALYRMWTRAMTAAGYDFSPFDPKWKETRGFSFLDCAKEEIVSLDDKIRNSYEEKIDCDAQTLALILSMDGCFILETLRSMNWTILHHERVCLKNAGEYYEHFFHPHKISYTESETVDDILKLENQVPIIVLRKLLELEHSHYSGESPSQDLLNDKLLEVARPFLELCPFQYIRDLKQWSWPQQDEVYDEVPHLLGLMHTFIVPSCFNDSEPTPRCMRVCMHRIGACMGWVWECMRVCIHCMGRRRESYTHPLMAAHRVLRQQDEDEDEEQAMNDEDEDEEEAMNYVGSIPRAIELRNAGIKFNPCRGIKEINFDPKNATIYLPRILIDDSTEILLRNLIAFEMCKPFKINRKLPKRINYVAWYLCLMEKLIDSEEDVALLRKMGIVTNCPGSDKEVAELFNRICNGVTVALAENRQVVEQVNMYYKSKFKVYFAELTNEYFSSPWKILGLVAATVLLLLTVVQTIFTIISVYK